jgi:hypothetical protein
VDGDDRGRVAHFVAEGRVMADVHDLRRIERRINSTCTRPASADRGVTGPSVAGRPRAEHAGAEPATPGAVASALGLGARWQVFELASAEALCAPARRHPGQPSITDCDAATWPWLLLCHYRGSVEVPQSTS